MTTPTADTELLRIVALALEARARGEQPTLEQLCADRPDLATAVAEALQLASGLQGLQSAAAEFDRTVGRVLANRYRLERRIGAGSMGIVYRAVDLELQRPVAVKILRSDLLVGDTMLARFAREAEALAAVVHPAIVAVHDRGRTDDQLSFLVMELLEGEPLDDLLERVVARAAQVGLDGVTGHDLLPTLAASPESASYVRTAVRWIAELADGLAAAHLAGIYHRDVKPSNVFIRRDGRPVLIDFGIAARAGHGTLATRDGTVGTPAYMAPELLDAEGTATASTDVYGLAATLYHLLTLRPPYVGSLAQVLASVQRRDPAPAARLRRNLPVDLQAILDRAMAREPAARYASTIDFAADLRAFLDYRPVQARPISAVHRLWRMARRSPQVRAAAAALLVASFALSFWILRDAQAGTRRREFAAAWAQVPPALSLQQNPAARCMPAGPGRDGIARLLDRTVALSERALPARLLRASFCADHGDALAASADYAAIAAELATPYAAALARAAAVGANGPGGGAAAAGPWPVPVTADDCYLDAYRRYRERAAAADLPGIILALRDKRLAGHLAAGELQLIVLMETAELSGERAVEIDHYRLANALALQLAAAHGPTATTEFALATSLVGQDRSAEALPVFARAVELAPLAFGIRRNYGVALRRHGQGAAAVEQFEAAIAIRADLPAVFETLARVHTDRQEWERADAAVARAPYVDSPRGDGQRRRMQGELLLKRARVLGRQEMVHAAELAGSAAEHFDAATTAGIPVADSDQAWCEALRAQDLGRLRPLLWNRLADDPVAWQQLADLLDLFPETLTSDETASLRTYLQGLLAHFAPELTDPVATAPPSPVPGPASHRESK